MKKKLKITNKTLVLTAVIGSLLILAMMSVNTIRVTNQSKDATDEAVSAVSSFYLESMADRRVKTITNLISNNFDELKKAIDFIENEKVESQEELRDIIGKAKSLLGLSRFALVDEDNVVYTQYTTYTGRSRHEFLSENTIEGQTISTVSFYGSSKQLCLAVPTPDLFIMGKPFKACFVQLDIKDIVDLLAFDDRGTIHFALYSKNGANLSGTELGSIIGDHNFFDAIKDIVSEEAWKESHENFANETGGSMTFSSDGVEETLFYGPIQGTDWTIAVLIRESVIQVQIQDINEKTLAESRKQVIFTFVSVLMLAAVLLIQVWIIHKDKLEEEKRTSRAFYNMANTDSLTGVRNKNAYSENETVINKQIQAGELEKLAVVVADINGLKIVNDTQGHAAGDQLIKDACALICEYFVHGAVFRVGGDEFVILLRGKGYDTMHEVLRELNQKVEENIKNNAVVVSTGCSVLKPEDQQLRDVFERADQIMYERKKELKSMGAQTRRQ